MHLLQKSKVCYIQTVEDNKNYLYSYTNKRLYSINKKLDVYSPENIEKMPNNNKISLKDDNDFLLKDINRIIKYGALNIIGNPFKKNRNYKNLVLNLSLYRYYFKLKNIDKNIKCQNFVYCVHDYNYSTITGTGILCNLELLDIVNLKLIKPYKSYKNAEKYKEKCKDRLGNNIIIYGISIYAEHILSKSIYKVGI